MGSFFGINTVISDLQKVTDGFSPDSMNWITGDENDCIILRRGTNLLGKTRNLGAGKVSGMGIGKRPDETQIPFFSYADTVNGGQKVKYYDVASNDTIEAHAVGSAANLLPAGSESDTVFMEPYQNLAGSFIMLSSINSDIYKIPVANPASAAAQSSKAFKGGIKFGQSRGIMFNISGINGSKDITGEYMSWIDRVIIANYMTTTLNEAGVTGLKDMSSQAPPNNLASGSTYNVFIDGVAAGPNGYDTFKWQKASGTFTTNVEITPGLMQYLADGVSVIFQAGTGHTLNDEWIITSAPAFVLSEAVGIAGATNYPNHQLAQVPGALNHNNFGARTAFNVTIQGNTGLGIEKFTDDQNGNLVSNFGGTGSVNYATGIVSVTFKNVTTGNVTASYYWEDSTQRGVFDMSIQYDPTQTPPSRIAGSGRYFPQFDGGGSNRLVLPLANVFYGFHNEKTWQTSIPTNDDDTSTTPASNLSFRELMGISSARGAFGNADGIYFINSANKARPQVYQIIPKTGATAASLAAPQVISQFLNLAPFAFDVATVFVWDIFILFSCQQIRNGRTDAFNSRTFVYNTKSGAWDLTDYPASCFVDYDGGLLSGDPLSNNIFQLFSGFDDDGSLIPNHWASGATNHGADGEKTTQRMVVNGLIQTAQRIRVSIALDGGAFTPVFIIEGDGSYVDRSRSISVGQFTIGSKITGGGGEVFANPFEVEFGLNTDRYEYIRIMFEAINGGYAQINFYEYKMNKYKGQRVPPSRIAS